MPIHAPPLPSSNLYFLRITPLFDNFSPLQVNVSMYFNSSFNVLIQKSKVEYFTKYKLSTS